MDLFNGMDWGAYNAFRETARQMPRADQLMRLGTELGSLAVIAVVLVAAVLVCPSPRRARMAIAVVVTFIFGYLLVAGIGELTHRPRPGDAENTLGSAALVSSFPSRDAFLTAFAWLMLATGVHHRFPRRTLGVIIYLGAAVLIAFVCFADLWLGLHWVTDVLAGLAGGIGLALVCHCLYSSSGCAPPKATA